MRSVHRKTREDRVERVAKFPLHGTEQGHQEADETDRGQGGNPQINWTSQSGEEQSERSKEEPSNSWE